MHRKDIREIFKDCIDIVRGTHWHSHFYPEKQQHEKQLGKELRELFPELYAEIDEVLQ